MDGKIQKSPSFRTTRVRRGSGQVADERVVEGNGYSCFKRWYRTKRTLEHGAVSALAKLDLSFVFLHLRDGWDASGSATRADE